MNLPDDISTRWVSDDPSAMAQRVAVLSPEERERLGTFKHAGRRLGFTMGRFAARTLAGEYLGVPPAEVALVVSEEGCVEVKDSDLVLSIAHSGACAVAAVGKRALGVDVEQVLPRRDDLYRFLLHPDEYHLLNDLPYDRNEIHLLCWTLKEATLKAMRTGFRISPKKLQLEIESNQQQASVHTENGIWHACYEKQDDYYWAVAYAG